MLKYVLIFSWDWDMIESLPLVELIDTKSFKLKHSTSQRISYFLPNINEDIHELNELIGRFNSYPQGQEALQSLYHIYNKRKIILSKYPEDFVSICSNFHQIFHVALFNDIKQNFRDLGVNSIADDFLKPFFINQSEIPSYSFVEFFANMEPEKINLIYSAVAKAKYPRQVPELLIEEVSDFPWSNYSIRFIGGKNALNFLVQSINGEMVVLSVIDNMNHTTQASLYLTEGENTQSLLGGILEGQIVKTYTQRCAFLPGRPGEINVKSFKLKEYCSQGDLQALSKRRLPDKEKLSSAINLYKQMAAILINIEKNGCAFPDMKNSNWLVNEDNKLLIGDDKSLMFSKDGMIKSSVIEKIIHSSYLCPPEVKDLQGLVRFSVNPCNVEKLHAFQFGMNLYQYLTGCENSFLNRCNSADDLNFSYGIFNNEVGASLVGLIYSLMDYNPEKRPSTQNVYNSLQNCNCQMILSQIEHYKFSENDEVMREYLEQMDINVEDAAFENPLTLDSIEIGLENTLNIFKNSRRLKLILNNFQKIDLGLFKPVVERRLVYELYNEFTQIPFRERVIIFDENNLEEVSRQTMDLINRIEIAFGISAPSDVAEEKAQNNQTPPSPRDSL